MPLRKIGGGGSGDGGGDGTGLDRVAVDARIRALVADPAESGNSSTWPDNKIPASIARDSELPMIAINSDVDGEIEDTKYITPLKLFRGIARKVVAATTNLPGIVTLARVQDVDVTETDTSRAVTVASAKRLADRLIKAIVPVVFRTGNTDRISISKIAQGIPDGTKFLRDDGVLAIPPGTDGQPGRDTGFTFYSRPMLTLTNQSNSQDISTTPWSQTLLSQEAIAGVISSDRDFSTEWFGSMTFMCGYNGTIRFIMRVTHVFNSKTLIVDRISDVVVNRQTPNSLKLNNLDAISSVAIGTYRDSGGNDVTITEADLAGPTTISLTLLASYSATRGSTGAQTISNIVWNNVAVRFYQLPNSHGEIPNPPVPDPYITSFMLTSGDSSPPAGSIASHAYDLEWAIANADRVGVARIIGFKGMLAVDGSNAATLLSIPAGGYAHGEGDVTIPNGVSLSADETYTLRLQVFKTGNNNPGLAATPISAQDRVITAHAPAAANYHWFRVERVANQDAATYAAAVDFSTDDLVTGQTLDTANGYNAVPGNAGDWIFGLAALASEPQPVGWTSGGQPASTVFQSAVDHNYGGVTYKVYVMHDSAYFSAGDATINYTPTVAA